MTSKLVQLTVPADREEETVSVLHDDSRIKGLVFLQAGANTSVLQFRVEDKDAIRVLNRLQAKGVGIRYGYCDVTQLLSGTSVGMANLGFSGEERGLSLTPAAIYKNICDKAALSRDVFILLVISTVVSAIGLSTDSQVYVVASMLMSPLMGPIIASSFGLATFSKELFVHGWRNTFILMAVTLGVSFVLGAMFCPFAVTLLWPTSQMVSRGVMVELLFGCLVALGGGVAVAVSECRSNVPSFVGIAIAASILPPAVNCGICLASLVLGPRLSPQADFSGHVYEELVLGSALLLLVNVLLIYSAAFVTFKMISPLQQFRYEEAESKDLGMTSSHSIHQRSLWREQQKSPTLGGGAFMSPPSRATHPIKRSPETSDMRMGLS